MKKIIATAIMAVHSGHVELTADQAKTRLHALTAVKVKKDTLAGIYSVTSPIQFKAGEEFGFDGEVAKDGRLFDPAAEELARAEAERAAEIRERQAYDRGVADAKAGMEAEIAARVAAELEKLTGPGGVLVAEPGAKPDGSQTAAAPVGVVAPIAPDLLTQPK